MSGDERDESLGGTDGADGGGTPSRQVPGQGGPGGARPGSSRAAGLPGQVDPTGSVDAAGAAGPSGPPAPSAPSGAPDAATQAGHSVPPQGTNGVRADDAEDSGWADSVPGTANASGGTRTGGSPGATSSGGGADNAGGGPGTEAHAVPSQREGGSAGSVLPPPRELPPSDADLVQRMRSGDNSAYEELFRRHSDAVLRYARTCCRDSHTADDLTAEVFARTLQAVRGGAGPEHAVRAYLLTTVRRVAATWTKSAKREQLVEDFALFAAEASHSSDGASGETMELGADVRAMHEAEQSLAMQAFRSLPERWQAVLWHTTVEEESPSEVAPLFGLTANATAVLASRAREGLKQAYLQAHVSSALTSGGDCARYADRLGAYARGGLRMRAERGLRKHLEECAKCRLAAGELQHVNASIPALLPVAVIGWFAAGYSLKAAGVVAGGAVGAAGAGAAAASTSGGAGASAGAAGGAAASEGLGAPAKVGIGAAVAVAAAAGLVWAFTGSPKPAEPEAKPPTVQPVLPVPQDPKPPAPTPKPKPVPPAPAPKPKPTPSKAAPKPVPPAPKPKPTPPKPTPPAPTPPAPTPKPKPTPPKERPKPQPEPRVYQVNRLQYSVLGDHTGPEVVLGQSSWIWQRWGLKIGGQSYSHGVTVRARSSVTIELNRACTSYTAKAGVDDLTLGLGKMRFSVYGDGELLWRSPVVRGKDPAVPVQVSLAGRKKLRLVVEPHSPWSEMTLGAWADSRIACR
ncbi:sigma-70 family RNA polymerase sigma factor [Streptomyces sp. NPDC048057]|uniref:sigma-70 family RNA polymerase sigma factor n=1 Tax=Streptomyces sp. NPDC048057 TaxID=3155628 RepID=UPI0033E38D3D